MSDVPDSIFEFDHEKPHSVFYSYWVKPASTTMVGEWRPFRTLAHAFGQSPDQMLYTLRSFTHYKFWPKGAPSDSPLRPEADKVEALYRDYMRPVKGARGNDAYIFTEKACREIADWLGISYDDLKWPDAPAMQETFKRAVIDHPVFFPTRPLRDMPPPLPAATLRERPTRPAVIKAPPVPPCPVHEPLRENLPLATPETPIVGVKVEAQAGPSKETILRNATLTVMPASSRPNWMTLNQIVSNMLATRIGQMPEPRNFPADTRNLATIMTNMRHHEILGQADPSHRRQLEGLIGTKNYDELMLRCDRDLQAIDSVTLRRMQKEGAAAGSLQSR